MNVPKLLKPKQNMDGNIKRLLEEKPHLKSGEKQNIKDILSEIDDNPLYYKSTGLLSKIYEMLDKKSYELEKTWKNSEYWTREIVPNENDVFIISKHKDEIHYSFARVEHHNQEDFRVYFGIYEKEKRIKKVLVYNALDFILGGCIGSTVSSAIGMIGSAFLAQYLGIDRHKLLLYTSFSGVILTFTLGGMAFDRWIHRRNKKKMKKHYKDLILDDKETIKQILK